MARDRAFNFYYAENLELLEQAGAELVFWSPLEDAELPAHLQGLIFGGGFPEVFAEQLAANSTVRERVREAIATGIPTYAECGGLMYLCEALRDLQGQTWPMAGVLPTTAVMGRLTLGYRRAVALERFSSSTPLVRAGEMLWGHEFHHSRLEPEPKEPLFELWGNDLAQARTEGFGLANLHASYVHLHWGDLYWGDTSGSSRSHGPNLAGRFVEQCRRFGVSH